VEGRDLTRHLTAHVDRAIETGHYIGLLAFANPNVVAKLSDL